MPKTTKQANCEVIGRGECAEARRSINVFTELTLRDEQQRLINQAPIHMSFQAILDKHKTAVIMMPRGHGKTTQLISRNAWEIGKNPELRIKIFSNAGDEASKKGKAIMGMLDSAPYKLIFPNITHGREWNVDAFSVARESNWPDATLESYGIDSRATGGRADLIWLDDVDDGEVVYSEAVRKRNIERVSNVILNMLTPDGRCYCVCTPWHDSDTANTLATQYGWPVFKFPIHNSNPIWPERFTQARLEELKQLIGSLAYARAYELIPMDVESCPIKGAWFRFWDSLPHLDELVIAVDLAISQKTSADYTVAVLLGEAGNSVYVLDYLREHLDFPSTFQRLVQMAEQAQARFRLTPTIGVESVAYQRAMPQTLKQRTPFPIREIPADKDKYRRAQRLAIHVENGRVYLQGQNGNVHQSQKIIYDECCGFPVATHDDCVDALGYGVELLLEVPQHIYYDPHKDDRRQKNTMRGFGNQVVGGAWGRV